MTFGSLFAGIGGFDLGFERAGLTCRWQVEIDPFCQKVLAKHWPNVPRHDDVRTFPPVGDWAVDVVCGGFPCQDVSACNYNGRGIDGERSGLWSELLRVVRTLRPKFAVIENVPALTFRGLDKVLGDLAASGFDAEWQTIPASAFAAPHSRARLFIVAYPNGKRLPADEVYARQSLEAVAAEQATRLWVRTGVRKPSPQDGSRIRLCPDSGVCGVADGVPGRLDRYRGIGNAVLPDVAEWIGRRLIAATDA